MLIRAPVSQVLVPLLRTVKEAEDLVQAAKFPPVGKRGFGSPYSAKQFGPTISSLDLNEANENVLTMVQIETKEALEAVDEIAAVKGVDVLFVGPFDLGKLTPKYLLQQSSAVNRKRQIIGINIGHRVSEAGIPQELDDAISKVQVAAKKAGKKSGIYTFSGAHAKQCQQRGFDMVHVVTDYMGLEDVVKQYLTTAKN